jgi:hypothetical protein
VELRQVGIRISKLLEATKSVMKEDPAVYADGDVPDDEARLMLEWLNIIEDVEAENKGDDDMRWWEVLSWPSLAEWRPSTGTPALLPGDGDVGGNDLRRPLGRGFIEALVTDNLHIGRPELIELIFRCGQRPGRPAAGQFKTKVVTYGTEVNVNAFYRHSRIKQYLKDGRALRIETAEEGVVRVGEIFVALLDRDPWSGSGRDRDPPCGGVAPQSRQPRVRHDPVGVADMGGGIAGSRPAPPSPWAIRRHPRAHRANWRNGGATPGICHRMPTPRPWRPPCCRSCSA